MDIGKTEVNLGMGDLDFTHFPDVVLEQQTAVWGNRIEKQTARLDAMKAELEKRQKPQTNDTSGSAAAAVGEVAGHGTDVSNSGDGEANAGGPKAAESVAG